MSFDFGSGITLASFSCDGKHCLSIHRLYTYVSGSRMYGRAIFRTCTGISSGPTALVCFRLVVSLFTLKCYVGYCKV